MEDEGQAGVLQLVHEYFGFHWFDINTVNILLRADRSVLDLMHFKQRVMMHFVNSMTDNMHQKN